MTWMRDERSARAMWQHVGVALILAFLASVLSRAMAGWFGYPPLVPFYGAVAVGVWYGGLASALLTTLFSILAYGAFVFGSLGQWSLTSEDSARIVAFIVFAVLIAVIGLRRDHAEAAVRAGERRFRTMLETANEGVWLIDRDGRTEYANERLAHLLGATPERLAGGSVLDFAVPEEAAAVRKRLAANLGGQAEVFDMRIRRADGDEAQVLVGGSPVRDDEDRVVGALWLLTDVTERRRAERALRLLDEAGRVLASSLDYEETLQRVAWFAVPSFADWCVVDLIDEQGVARRVAVAHADPAAAELAGRLMLYPPADDFTGPEEQVIQTGEALLVEQMTEELVQRAAQTPQHLELLRAVGVISAVVVPLRAGGMVHGAMTFATATASQRHFDADEFALADQLARRAAVAIQNARLFRDAQDAEDRYRGLFEGTKDGIMVFDLQGAVADVNPALLALAGYRREELLGHPVERIAVGGPWSGEERERLRRDGQWRGEFELRRKDGAIIPVESWITRVSLPAGPAYVGVLRDVAARRHLERLQEEFISTLAHDLKNPLTTVRGQTQLLRRRIGRGEPPDIERLDAALEGIDAAAARMTRLLDELADVMRLRAGQEIDLNREPTDLVELTRRSVEEQGRTTERHQIRLVSDVAELAGYWDGLRLERVVANLLGNAIKYSPDGGEITVRVSREGNGGTGRATLSVTDRGVGIPASDLDLIFERFRRAGNVESIAGSGIGLAGAKRIVELHGGTISVTSTEGEGSTFTVRLPIAAGDD